ncbi:hypothetical protein [Streptomyces sp. NPDC048508]|uniref:hypothetical protein n=1 Tax=Streptomyces sp. NPDC048508 TaxID=3365561 RepID=UPI00371D0384
MKHINFVCRNYWKFFALTLFYAAELWLTAQDYIHTPFEGFRLRPLSSILAELQLANLRMRDYLNSIESTKQAQSRKPEQNAEDI